jgi:hypothetical protein
MGLWCQLASILVSVIHTATPDHYRSAPGSTGHRTAYRDMFAVASGTGFAHPDADLSHEIDNAEELAAERYHNDLAERHHRELDGPEAEEADPVRTRRNGCPAETETARGRWPGNSSVSTPRAPRIHMRNTSTSGQPGKPGQYWPGGRRRAGTQLG